MKRHLTLLVALTVALVGCSAVSEVAPVETVTVTATPTPVETPTADATPAPVREQEKDAERESAVPSNDPYQRDPRPPFGLILSSVESICVPPVEALPDLVNIGDSPEYVDALQMALFDLGYVVPFAASYNSSVVQVVQRMQTNLGVVPDGQVGPITWGALRDRLCPEWEEYFPNQGTSGGYGSTYEVRYEGIGYAWVEGSYATELGFNSGEWGIRDAWVKTISLPSGNVASLTLFHSPRSSYNRPLTCRIYVDGTLKSESITSRGGTAYCEYVLP